MNSLHQNKVQKSALIALMISATTAASILPISNASAQLFRGNRQRNTNNSYSINSYRQVAIPANTRIPLVYEGEEDKILIKPDESLDLTLVVSANIKDSQGNFLIPAGSEVEGVLQPEEDGDRQGSQFVAQTLIYPDGTSQRIDGLSQIVTRMETVEEGATGNEILEGALIGAGAGLLLGLLTGDNAPATEEILGAGALGALGGWLFGGNSVDLVSINPDRDLDITLQDELVIALR